MLRDSYLGYIVIRPLATIRIGRTALIPYHDRSQRIYITREYTSHLVNLKLSFQSLAFQQQDKGVGACATTAIWSSLQKVCEDNGYRSPGPYTISQKAVQYSIPFGRAFPQTTGLTSEQMYQAILSCGFTPLRVNCSDKKFNQFKGILLSYLKSKIPPILILRPLSGVEGHAVTVTGHSEKKRVCKFNEYIVVKDIDKIYIHDDRLGLYVRAYLQKRQFKKNEKEQAISQGFYSNNAISIKILNEEWLVSELIVPLYHKIRSTILDFFDLTYPFVQSLQEYYGSKDKLLLEVSLQKGGDFLESLSYDTRLPIKEKINFMKKIKLPRYVGVVKIFNRDKPYFTILWDTTDIPRLKVNNFWDYCNDFIGIICYDKDFRDLYINEGKMNLKSLVL